MIERASAPGNIGLAARARVHLVSKRIWADPDPDLEAELAILEQGLAIAEELGDEGLIAEHVQQLGIIRRHQGRFAEAIPWIERALAVAERGQDQLARRTYTRSLVQILAEGPTPVHEAIARCEQLHEASRDERSPRRDRRQLPLGALRHGRPLRRGAGGTRASPTPCSARPTRCPPRSARAPSP